MKEYKLNIKSWAEEDRPREKLSLKGRSALSDSELIAILIGSGNKDESAVELSKKILASINHDLNKLGKLSVNDLMQFNGIGEAKAISIIAALELGRRRKETDVSKKISITSSNVAYEEIQDVLSDLQHEEFWVIYLNRKNEVIKKVNISKGGVSGTIADAKIIFKNAIEQLASAIILCHNHPFGSIMPNSNNLNGGLHTYGFQNQLIDNEIKGVGNSVNYKYRMHDPRLGRFFAVDPLSFEYPWNSPYAFSENRVTNAIELEGLEAWDIGGGNVVNGPFKNVGAAKSAALSGKATISISEFSISAAKPMSPGAGVLRLGAAMGTISPMEPTPDPNMTYEEYLQTVDKNQIDSDERADAKFKEAFNEAHIALDDIAAFTDVNDLMVITQGTHTDGTQATWKEKIEAGIFLVIPGVSGGGKRGVKAILTNADAKKIAREMGWGEKLAHGNIPDAVRKKTGKNPVYYDKKTKRYYSPDKGGHRADNAWKSFDKSGNRETGIFKDGVFQKVSD